MLQPLLNPSIRFCFKCESVQVQHKCQALSLSLSAGGEGGGSPRETPEPLQLVPFSVEALL